MGDDLAARLNEIVIRLERDAEITAACGLSVTTKLLHMARLDLLCRIHDISDSELQAISDELLQTIDDELMRKIRRS
jgi:ribosomal protein S13